MSGIVVLTTDFGLADGYVGIIKGVVLGINPTATLVDLCHDVAPQDVAGAAFVLTTAWRFFPPGAIHLVVVDPGVGGERRAVAVRTPSATFVAPDNGVLSWVLREHGLSAVEPGRQPLSSSDVAAVELDDPRYWLPEVSATFHGRDVFAPVAAHLSLGVPLARLGHPVGDLWLLPVPEPRRVSGEVVGQVIRVDRFGNAITNLRSSDLAPFQPVEIEVCRRTVRGLRRFYSEAPGLGALVGGAGLVELALTGGSAAAALGAKVGDPVVAHRARPTVLAASPQPEVTERCPK